MGAEQRVVLEGEWDIARRDELRDLLATAVAAAEPGRTFVLDLRDVEFIDSSALSIFLNTSRRLIRARVKMVTVCRADTIVARAIAVTNLGDTLNLLEVD